MRQQCFPIDDVRRATLLHRTRAEAATKRLAPVGILARNKRTTNAKRFVGAMRSPRRVVERPPQFTPPSPAR